MGNEIIEGNEIIANFLGFKKQLAMTINGEFVWHDDKYNLPVGELEFHKDWNWLMPVIVKLKSKKLDLQKHNFDVFKVWEIVVLEVSEKMNVLTKAKEPLFVRTRVTDLSNDRIQQTDSMLCEVGLSLYRNDRFIFETQTGKGKNKKYYDEVEIEIVKSGSSVFSGNFKDLVEILEENKRKKTVEKFD